MFYFRQNVDNSYNSILILLGHLPEFFFFLAVPSYSVDVICLMDSSSNDYLYFLIVYTDRKVRLNVSGKLYSG